MLLSLLLGNVYDRGGAGDDDSDGGEGGDDRR